MTTKRFCKWKMDKEEESWVTGCGRRFCFENDGSLEANHFGFCYSCGMKIREIKSSDYKCQDCG